jgi:O-antigen ligase/tetratricopeptide (TPR) repeat protein
MLGVNRQIPDMSKIIFNLFIFILLFSPLAFGTVEPWSFTIMETSSVFALLLLLVGRSRQKQNFLYETPGLVPLLCFQVYIMLQFIPLPPDIVRTVSPETYRLYRETVFPDGPLNWVSLSINREHTLMEFFRISSYAAFYVLTVQLLSKKEFLEKTIAVTALFASGLSFFAVIQHLLSNNKIFWFRQLTQEGPFFGPYVNRNHYAGLMEMLFPLVLGLFLYYKPQVHYRSFREKMSGLFNLKETNIYIVLGFSAVLIATSVFLTLSRSGIVSLCVSLIFFGILFFYRGMDKKKAVVIVVIGLLIALTLGWFGWSSLFERFGAVKDARGNIAEVRLPLWKDSINIIKDFPLAGTGFGTFVNIYPGYRTVPGDYIAEHAHNDYLELLSDGGVITALITGWFLITFFYKSFRVFGKRREMYSVYMFIAAVTGMFALFLHSITDFNLHIGANGLYFFFLMGLAVSAANTRLREGLGDTYLTKMSMPLTALRALTVVLFIGCLIFNSGVLLGKGAFSSIKDIKLNAFQSSSLTQPYAEKRDHGVLPEKISHDKELSSVRNAAYRAAFFDPLNAKYQYAVANIEWSLANRQSALDHYMRAVQLNPAGGEYLQRLGLIKSELGENRTADKLLRAGIQYDVHNPVRYRQYALWLFAEGERQDGIRIMKSAVALEPRKTGEYITVMVLNRFTDGEIFQSLPERAGPYLYFAAYLSGTGNDRMAEDIYLRAFDYLGKEDRADPSYFYQIQQYYMKKARTADALKVMSKAVKFYPLDAGIRLAAAGLYEKLEMRAQAVEEYTQALRIDPVNHAAKAGLDRLITVSSK